MAVSTPSMPHFHLRNLSQVDDAFSCTIIDSPAAHGLPRSSSRVPLLTRQKSVMCLTDARSPLVDSFNLSPIRFGSPLKEEQSAELSSSKLDTTYTEMVVKALVQKRALQSACKRRLMSRLSQASPLAQTPATPKPVVTTPLKKPGTQVVTRSRMASIRRCRTSAVDSVVAASRASVRLLKQLGGQSSEESRPAAAVDNTLELTTQDSRTWSAKRRRISQAAEEVLESTRISQVLPDRTPPRISPCLQDPSLSDLDISDVDSTMEQWSADPVPILELSEKGSPACPQPASKFYQAYKGQLQLSVYMNSGLLTVHVIQAEGLTSRCQPLCDSYIKLSIVPDALHKSRSKTETVCGSNSPGYDEKFSFELVPEDFSKRLLISVWNREQKTRKCELLGCMSFGLQGIQAKKNITQGWFYLLSDAIGRSRHLQAVPRKTTPPTTAASAPKLACSTDPHDVEPLTLAMRKGRSGYGFSVTGGHPAQVSRVDPQGPAHRAGLHPGDWIIRINGENVSTATADCVGRIIRHYQRQIVLEVCRQKVRGPNPNGTTPCLPRQSPWLPSCSILDSSSSSCGSSVGESTVDTVMEQPSWERNTPVAPRKYAPLQQHRPSSGVKRKRVKFSEYLNFR